MKLKILSPDVLSILIQRVWQGGSGLVTLWFVATHLTQIEQGWYYTFTSLTAIQIVFDMGLSTVLIQTAAHEFSGLSWGPNGRVTGQNQLRFSALVGKSVIWYSGAACCFLITIPIGFLFFSSKANELGYNWQWAWILVVAGTGGNLLILPFLALIEGTGRIREVYFVRLIQGISGAATIWVVLILKGGIYATAAMPLLSLLIGASWLFFFKRDLICLAFQVKRQIQNFSWRIEVWPFQWRIGVSWLCSYLLLLFHTPLLFRTQGAVVAGQMGLSMTIANMIGLLSQAWITSQVPGMAKAASLSDWKSLDNSFVRGGVSSLMAYVAGAAIAIIVRWMLIDSPYSERLLPPYEFIGLLFVVLIIQSTGILASQLRAFRREPFMIPTIMWALLTVVGAVYAAPHYSAKGIILVMIIVNGGIGLPVSIWLWKRYNSIWRNN